MEAEAHAHGRRAHRLTDQAGLELRPVDLDIEAGEPGEGLLKQFVCFLREHVCLGDDAEDVALVIDHR
jgi:hypothetical protein